LVFSAQAKNRTGRRIHLFFSASAIGPACHAASDFKNLALPEASDYWGISCSGRRTMEIEIPCPKCRNTRMKFERPQPLDSDMLTCFTCGHELGTLGSVKAKMLAALERMEKQGVPRKQ
jgi:ribosomal protein S27E